MSELTFPNRDGPALVLGSAGVDIVGRLKGDIRLGTSLPAQIRTTFGGVARNVAENLARLGQSVRLITVVGNDEQGERLLKGLESAGVDISATVCTTEYATGAYIAAINGQGELQFGLDDMRAINCITPEYLRKRADLFRDASALFIDANLPKDVLRTAVSLARRSRLPICADPASAVLAARLKPYLSALTLIAPNNEEACILCDLPKVSTRKQALQAAKCLVSQGVALAIITMGEQGLCYATSETSGHIPALRTEILDPTGAGDALSAAVITALLNDIPVDDAVRLGVSAASLTLRYRGAVAPDLSLEKLYDQLVI
ncbi:MAG: carbohydrate kinase family protein [Chloroflexi bacterium]|nr:carbohydrate kinase family protein [Chloroflexota bacterium]